MYWGRWASSGRWQRPRRTPPVLSLSNSEPACSTSNVPLPPSAALLMSAVLAAPLQAHPSLGIEALQSIKFTGA